MFFLVLDLATLFDLYHQGNAEEALDTLTEIRFVPLFTDEVD